MSNRVWTHGRRSGTPAAFRSTGLSPRRRLVTHAGRATGISVPAPTWEGRYVAVDHVFRCSGFFPACRLLLGSGRVRLPLGHAPAIASTPRLSGTVPCTRKPRGRNSGLTISERLLLGEQVLPLFVSAGCADVFVFTHFFWRQPRARRCHLVDISCCSEIPCATCHRVSVHGFATNRPTYFTRCYCARVPLSILL